MVDFPAPFGPMIEGISCSWTSNDTNVLNFAHAQLYVLGGFVTYEVAAAGLVERSS